MSGPSPAWHVACSNCGAPLRLTPGARVAICLFCNASLQVAQTADRGAPVLQSTPVAPADIERVKKLILDGRRSDAIDLYASLAHVARRDAEVTIDSLALSAVRRLSADAPLSLLGVPIFGLFMAPGAVAVAWGVGAFGERPDATIAVVLGGAWVLWIAWGILRRLRSNWVRWTGAFGRARVLEYAELRPFGAKAVVVLLALEVTPERGGAPFIHERALLVGTVALPKLAVGNVIRVRFDAGRTRVFPTSPITVLASLGR